jgi:hypothetical protein
VRDVAIGAVVFAGVSFFLAVQSETLVLTQGQATVVLALSLSVAVWLVARR